MSTEILAIPDTDGIVITENVADIDESQKDDKKRHIVNPPNNLHIWKPGMAAQDIVDIARVRGIEVVALCGKTWVPNNNVAGRGTCDDCLRIAGEILGAM